jgi:Glycosyl-4,4'-diaponeurosporenoate acyltransferase
MSKYFKFFFVLAIVVFILASVALWKGLHTFLFAWILNLMLMMAILEFTKTFKPKLISTYYETRKWEDEGKIYKWLGVNWFRKLMVFIGWEKLNKAANPVKKSLDALIYLEYGTRKSEFEHSIIFFIVLALTFFVAFYYGFKQIVWLLMLNVLLNAYPVVVQRYNRPRLRKAINKIKGFSTGA